ncbi:hypothetical protein TNCV_311341 [Trichonephila clavipes]|nr:hypothetical protein TNCV_311341 [Trichonephila clavipes]
MTFSEFGIEIVEELLHKYDDASSVQKKPSRPLITLPDLVKDLLVSHILPTPAKREPTKKIIFLLHSLSIEANYDGEVLAVYEATTQLLAAAVALAKVVFSIDFQAAISALRYPTTLK